MDTLPNGTLLGKKWRINSFVGEGACGKVYAVTSTAGDSSIPLVAKVIPLPKGSGKAFKESKRICDTLFYEGQQMVGQLMKFPFLPKIPDITTFRGVDESIGVRFMVIERLDRDLADFSRSNPPPSAAQIARIGLQLLEGLQWLHAIGLLFIDVKPDNFMLRGNELVFIDYGCIERWRDATGAQKPLEARGGMAGTPAYASLSVHNLNSPSRKDDLEAMGLVLLAMFDGCSLPWSQTTSEAECKRMKDNCDILKLATERRCPEVGRFIMDCRNYDYDQNPNYAALRALLEKLSHSKATAAAAHAPSKRASHASLSPAPLNKKQKQQSVVEEEENDEDDEDVMILPPTKVTGGEAAAAARGRGRGGAATAAAAAARTQTEEVQKLSAAAAKVSLDAIAVDDEVGDDGKKPSASSSSSTSGGGSRARVKAAATAAAAIGGNEDNDNKRSTGSTTAGRSKGAVKKAAAAAAAVDSHADAASAAPSTPSIPSKKPPARAASASAAAATGRGGRVVNMVSIDEEEDATKNINDEEDEEDDEESRELLRSPVRHSVRLSINSNRLSTSSAVSAVSVVSSRRTSSLIGPFSFLGASNISSPPAVPAGAAGGGRGEVSAARGANNKKKRSSHGCIIDIVEFSDDSATAVPGPEQVLRLLIVEGPHKGQEWVLGKSSSQKIDEFKQRVIGRESGDLELSKDDYTSQKHFKAMWCWNRAGELDLNVLDLKSSNGTRLNGKKLKANSWEHSTAGDTIKVGKTVIKIELTTRRAAAAAR